jgi:lipopolysaccharide export system protein LptA
MRLFLFLFCSVISVAAFAADEKQPLEITADSALEWNQAAKTYVARGAAMAKQGDMSVKADTLTATYAGVNNSTSDITQLVADGHVTLSSATDIATGDKAVYDLSTGQATLTGTRPKIIQNGKNSLEADQIIVWTKDTIFNHAEAIGNVVITSGTQTATGDKATFSAATSIAELVGHVKIKQGENWLEGDKAEMNTKTHISTMTSKNGTGRVKGVFYSGSGQKK